MKLLSLLYRAFCTNCLFVGFSWWHQLMFRPTATLCDWASPTCAIANYARSLVGLFSSIQPCRVPFTPGGGVNLLGCAYLTVVVWHMMFWVLFVWIVDRSEAKVLQFNTSEKFLTVCFSVTAMCSTTFENLAQSTRKFSSVFFIPKRKASSYMETFGWIVYVRKKTEKIYIYSLLL